MENCVILVNLGVYQNYTNDNITNLLKYGNNVILIIDEHLIDFVKDKEKIKIVKTNELDLIYFENNSKLNSSYRQGFWKNCSKRLFCVYELMKKFNITKSFHIENDVMLFGNINEIKIPEEKVYLTMDSKTRCIPGIMYIPKYNFIDNLINNYRFRGNDMKNLGFFFNRNKKICETFPIINQNSNYPEINIFNKNYDKFNIIFDAAAIGQYLGGVDPRNISGNTIGFINETCVIKYNKFNFVWEILNGNKVLYLVADNKKIRVFNIHVHCKNLKQFI